VLDHLDSLFHHLNMSFSPVNIHVREVLRPLVRSVGYFVFGLELKLLRSYRTMEFGPLQRRFLLDLVGKERGTNFDFSNLGASPLDIIEENCNEDERGKRWQIERVKFSRSALAIAGAIKVGCVTGADGCFSFKIV
jgi:hypothetical protein